MATPLAPTTKNTTTPPAAGARPAPARMAPTDPQPQAPQIKPGATDKASHHLHAGAQHKPTAQQIERRAYDIWQRRGGGDGNAAVDWLQAERELLTEINARNAD